MVLSLTTTYAIRILVYMAENVNEHITAVSLFNALHIRQQYMRRILTQLAREGFIAGSRGRNGGFVFARQDDSIFVADVIRAVEGHNPVEKCILGVSDCGKVPVCKMHAIWTETRDNLLRTFSTTSIHDLAMRNIG